MTIHPLSSSFVRNKAGEDARQGSQRLGLRGSLMGLSISGLVLASTALVPASVAAQPVDLGTGSVTLNVAADFIPGSIFTNGEVIIQPFATFVPSSSMPRSAIRWEPPR